MKQYADLELSLHRREEGAYTVEFRYTHPGSDTDTGFGQGSTIQANIDPTAKDYFPKVLEPAKYGRKLTDDLFSSSDLKTVFENAIVSAQTQNLPLRVRLWIGPENERLPTVSKIMS